MRALGDELQNLKATVRGASFALLAQCSRPSPNPQRPPPPPGTLFEVVASSRDGASLQAATDAHRAVCALERQRSALESAHRASESLLSARQEQWRAERVLLEAGVALAEDQLARSQRAFEGERRIKEALQRRLDATEASERVRRGPSLPIAARRRGGRSSSALCSPCVRRAPFRLSPAQKN